MALVLGPETDLFLRGIGEDLKGKTILEEPYVDRKTIVRAVSEQNKVILALQSQLLQMREVEKGMQQKLEMIQDKVTFLEKYTDKVDSIEGILREKVPVLDKVNEVVKEHDVVLHRVSTKVKENSQALTAFKVEARGSISQNRESLKILRTEVESMPEKIVISSRQVTHSLKDEKIDVNVTRDGDDKEVLANIIAQQEQHAFVQDEDLKRLETKVKDNDTSQNERMENMKRNVGDLIEWKRAQSSVDLEKMKSNQDLMKAKIDEYVKALSHKMSKEDVEAKLDRQFNEIVDHLQSALSSIENEEADFKYITDSLSKMCESLREKKADKAEVLALRKQFIENQVEGDGPRGGSTLDNEAIRRILSNYPTKDVVLKMLQGCETTKNISSVPELGRIDSQIQHLHSAIQQIYKFLPHGPGYDKLAVNRPDNEEKNSPEESHPTQKEVDESQASLTDAHLNSTERRSDSSVLVDKKEFETSLFPSSNVLGSAFGKIKNNEKSYHGGKDKPTLQKKKNIVNRSTRPSSAPHKKTFSEPNIVKKHSLPAILTSISKTMRPRSKIKSKLKNHGNIVHKGSYHVMDSYTELGRSSDHFISQPSSEYLDRPRSSEQRSRRNQCYQIRTSIE